MKVLVVDDEERARESIVQMLSLYCPEVSEILQAEGVQSALEVLSKHTPAVILLDIRLKDGSGFDLVKQIGERQLPVIFISAHEEYAIKAFQVSALHYLLKPIDPDELIAALKKVQEKNEREKLEQQLAILVENTQLINRSSSKIVLKTLDSIHVVPVAEIIYCEADKNYTTFYLDGKAKIVVSKSIGEYEELLPSHMFLRIHQSILLNLSFIDRYDRSDGGMVITKQGQQLAVSTRKKDQLMAYLNTL